MTFCLINNGNFCPFKELVVEPGLDLKKNTNDYHRYNLLEYSLVHLQEEKQFLQTQTLSQGYDGINLDLYLCP